MVKFQRKHLTPQTSLLHPVSGTGSDIAKCILKYLEDNDVDINELESTGFKGTVTNTGWNNGVIRNIECKIQRPLQWFICLLHFNELPIKHLFEYLDGETTRIASFFGKIGKKLTNCEILPIINFEAIQLDEINVNKTDLCKDQQNLLDIFRPIQTGQCSPDLAVRDPGSLNHSRWLSCAIRVLLTLVHFPNKPYKRTQNLVNYIMKTCAPVCLSLKDICSSNRVRNIERLHFIT
ncbi:hypothetical protein AVEN_23639-1 [Araneus ventricosus]|uniref:Uncharacterized protein n=1 Tax=Araneus ventricosus TaxID=182803 RepID=A0A4Y2BH62_ARAVE|nr:hypothetical protein AVEN_23639-1 [Araneus ventricosus]